MKSNLKKSMIIKSKNNKKKKIGNQILLTIKKILNKSKVINLIQTKIK